MTKDELSKENKLLKEKIQEQKHLSSAVEAKDNEITELKDRITDLQTQLKEALSTLNKQKHLSSAVEAKDNEITELKKTYEEKLANQSKTLAKINDDTVKQYTEIIEGYRRENIRRVNQLNKVFIAHGNLLKSLQGTLDIALLANEYLGEEISKKEGE